MADYSRTRTTLKSTMASIKALLETYTSWNVAEHNIPTIGNVFDYQPDLLAPCCILMYNGSQGAMAPFRTSSFSVIVATECYSGQSTSTDSTQDLVEKALELLDFQPISSTVWTEYVGDKTLKLDNYPNLIAVQIEFKAEDH